jgi:hypothetical protein
MKLRLLEKLVDPRAWRYQLHGLLHRWEQKSCPECGIVQCRLIDAKGMHRLYECGLCSLVYRHPRESADEMQSLYQQDYEEAGLTTDLPDPETLSKLLKNNFAGSEKDFQYVISILKSLGIVPGMRVLDFGANWGYLSFQLKNAGYVVESFEISSSRAAFGQRLGIDIRTNIDQVSGPFDCVISSHVIEHVPNPAATLRQQYEMVKAGGLIVCFTPNGSEAWRNQSGGLFHRSWGLVHPVLLTRDFVRKHFSKLPYLVTSNDSPDRMGQWNQNRQDADLCDGGGLIFVVRKSTLQS